ncbi:MAG: sigma-E factor negative regulatory protein [Gammaproteobacteria bacterium]|tara:strand:- start:8192 stop:8878 length:687 start_codon:yes stop_codon:yes gene_type:complete
MNDINEKLSALYDGELSKEEIDDLLDIINKDSTLQKKLSMYSLIGLATSKDETNIVSIESKKNKTKNFLSNIWLSNTLTAAASILLTLTIVNNIDFSRMNISIDSTNQISSAINSKEAKETALKSEEYLADYIMKVINEPNFMNSNRSLDLQNVGFSNNLENGYLYSKGNENFKLRIEKNNFGLKKVRYWKHGNKIIYLVPLSDGRAVTLYGNISISTALAIAQSITK